MSGKGSKLPQRTSTLRRSIEHHANLLELGERSAPQELGKVTILFSCERANKREREILDAHVETLKSRHECKAEVVLHANPQMDDLANVFRDRWVSSIIMLGHGSLSTMRLYNLNDHGHHNWSWYDTAAIAEHLKTGFFEQRTCARINDPDKHVRVPIGTFVMVDQSRILAPVGRSFGPNAGSEHFDALMHPVYENPVNSAAELLEPIHI